MRAGSSKVSPPAKIALDGARLFRVEFTELPGAPSQYQLFLEQGLSNYTIKSGEFPANFTSVNSLLVISAVPEPHACVLFSVALGGWALAKRRRLR